MLVQYAYHNDKSLENLTFRKFLSRHAKKRDLTIFLGKCLDIAFQSMGKSLAVSHDNSDEDSYSSNLHALYVARFNPFITITHPLLRNIICQGQEKYEENN